MRNEIHDYSSLLSVRAIGKNGDLLGVGKLYSVTRFKTQPGDIEIWHCHVIFKPSLIAPMWHSPTMSYKWDAIDFTLPSGWQNIWGQGNNFDVDEIRIDPEDLEIIIGMNEFIYAPPKLSNWGKIKNFFKKVFVSG